MPLLPQTKQTYHTAVSGGDMIGLIVMLQKEVYLKKAMDHPEFDWLLPLIPPVRGDGLHVFRTCNQWAKQHSFTLESIRSILRTQMTSQSPFLLNPDVSK